jgi:hypothetical protein
MADGYPFWVVLYYLVRSGSFQDALDYASHFDRYLAKTEKRFLDYFVAWATSKDKR